MPGAKLSQSWEAAASEPFWGMPRAWGTALWADLIVAFQCPKGAYEKDEGVFTI